MNQYPELLKLLEETLSDSSKLESNISKFQNAVWHSEVDYPDKLTEETLSTLAYDLDYYEADPKLRFEDPSFFGEDKAMEEIRLALAVIRQH